VGDRFRARIFSGEYQRWVARQQLLQAKNQHRYEHQCWYQSEKATHEEGEHEAVFWAALVEL
jgi:hypothetical protein